LIFVRYGIGKFLQSASLRDIIKKSVFQMSGENALPGAEKRFLHLGGKRK